MTELWEFLFAVTLAAHLLCVNVAAGAPIIALGCEWGDARGDKIARRAGRYLTLAGVVALVVGMVLGLLLIALAWSPEYATGLQFLQRKLIAGLGEALFSAVLYIVCLLLWRGDSSAAWLRGLRGLLGLLNGTNLLYHFPLLFLVLQRVLRDPPAAAISNADFRRLALVGEIPALAVHVVLASLAMAGVTLFGLALRRGREGAPEAETSAIAVWGARVAVVPTLCQIPVGLWIMSSLSPSDNARLMGGSTTAFVCFIAGFAAAVYFLQQLATVASGDTHRRTLIRSMGLSVLVVLLMTISWRFLRS